MPTKDFTNRKSPPYQWGRWRAGHVHYDWSSASRRFSESPQHAKRYATARHIVKTIANRSRSRTGETPQFQKAERLRPEFNALVEQWRRETGFLSSSDEKVLNSAYQSIIAMGIDAVPLVLEELAARRGHWSWALHFMTKGVDPIPEAANVDAARDAWLKWGRQKRYLK